MCIKRCASSSRMNPLLRAERGGAAAARGWHWHTLFFPLFSSSLEEWKRARAQLTSIKVEQAD